MCFLCCICLASEINVLDYKLVGQTRYLSKDEIALISKHLSSALGKQSKESIQKTLLELKNQIKGQNNSPKYDFKANLSGANYMVVPIEVKFLIQNVTYQSGNSEFKKVNIPSLKQGKSLDSIDRRELLMLQDNPMRNTKLTHSIDKFGNLNTTINEQSQKQKHFKFFIDDHKRGDNTKERLRTGLELSHANVFGFDDTLRFVGVSTKSSGYSLASSYHLPLYGLHSEIDASFGYSKSKGKASLLRARGKTYEGDLRYTYNLPLSDTQPNLRSKIYLGFKNYTYKNHSTLEIPAFKGATLSDIRYKFLTPYFGYNLSYLGSNLYYNINLSYENSNLGTNDYKSDYYKYQLQAFGLYRFSNLYRAKLFINSNIASKNTPTQFRDELVGAYAVRSSRHTTNAILANKSLISRFELEAGTLYRGFIFYDIGFGLNDQDEVAKKHRISTAGFGLRAKFADHLNIDGYAGVDLVNTNNFEDKISAGFKAELQF